MKINLFKSRRKQQNPGNQISDRDRLQNMIDAAKQELLIADPYFYDGPLGEKLPTTIEEPSYDNCQSSKVGCRAYHLYMNGKCKTEYDAVQQAVDEYLSELEKDNPER